MSLVVISKFGVIVFFHFDFKIMSRCLIIFFCHVASFVSLSHNLLNRQNSKYVLLCQNYGTFNFTNSETC